METLNAINSNGQRETKVGDRVRMCHDGDHKIGFVGLAVWTVTGLFRDGGIRSVDSEGLKLEFKHGAQKSWFHVDP